MSAYLKQWGLACESVNNPEGLNRIGSFAFTRDEAEHWAKQWNLAYGASKPVFVVNLKSE